MAAALTLALLLPGLAACGDGSPGANEGDCTIKVIYDDVVYRAAGGASLPRAGKSLDAATFGDCAGRPLTSGSAVGRLYAVPKVDPGRAVLLRQEGSWVLYVKESLSRRQWPDVVRAASSYPRCRNAVTFTGTWYTVDAEAMPDEGDFHAEPPYTASFKAERGTGLDFERWSQVGLEARITERTDPVPGPGFLRRALDGKPVTVRATCAGSDFEVRAVQFAD